LSRINDKVYSELMKVSCTTAWGVLGTILRDPLVRDSYRMMKVRPLNPTYRVCGPALTVRYIAYDPLNPTIEAQNLQDAYQSKIEEITEAINPGDVVVAAALGRVDAGVFGDGICTGFKAKGASGVVVDGSLRDMPVIRKLNFPVFTIGPGTPTTAAYHIHDGKPSGVLPAEVNVPVICDGVRVRPGDFIIGDEDGVMVIPSEYVEDVARLGGAVEDVENVERKLILEGKLVHGQMMSEEQAREHGILEQWKLVRDVRTHGIYRR